MSSVNARVAALIWGMTTLRGLLYVLSQPSLKEYIRLPAFVVTSKYL